MPTHLFTFGHYEARWERPIPLLMATGPGANDTGEKAPLLPCLKEPTWFGRDDSVCRPLWEQQSSRFMPWVAVGYDHPHTFEFIATKRLAELHTTAEELQSRALAALRERPAKWQSVEIPAHDGVLQVLVCMDDFFAAERVLDPAFMQEAQRTLDARGLFVGVPRRGVLMATSADQDRQRITSFAGAVAGQFSRGASALISPMLFLIKDGEIIGIFDAVAGAMMPDGKPIGAPGGNDDEDDEDKPDDPGAPFVSAMVTRNDQGTEDLHLMAGGADFARLAKGIEEGFNALLQQHLPRNEFSGHIEIVILGMTPPALRKQMPKLLEHLRGICNDLSRGTERRCGVVMTFQKDALADSVPAPRVTTGAARPAAQSPSTWRRFVRPAIIVGGIALAVIVQIVRTASVHDHPDTIDYQGASLSRANIRESGGTSAAVYVPAGEVMPGTSLQLGVIVSTEHATAAGLLTWVREQSQLSSGGVFLHDAASTGERCLIGAGGPRPFLSLQLCQGGDARAACIESDRVQDSGVLTSCQTAYGCFDRLCKQRWQDERAAMESVLNSALR